MNITATVIKTTKWLFNEIQCQKQTNLNPCLITYSLCFPFSEKRFCGGEGEL